MLLVTRKSIITEVTLGAVILLAGGVALVAFMYTEREADEIEWTAPFLFEGTTGWTSVATFVDYETGLRLDMPKAWKSIQYRIDKGTKGNGTRVYTLVLPYVNEAGELTEGFATSEIHAIPVFGYTAKNRVSEPNDVLLGSNSSYAFVSKEFSPEAFSACVDDKTFREGNTELCKGGSRLRNPERLPHVFSLEAIRIDPNNTYPGEVLGYPGAFTRNENQIYLWGRVFRGADVATFEVLPYWSNESQTSQIYLYSKDRNHVYFSSGDDSYESADNPFIIESADVDTFMVLGGPGSSVYSRDHDSIFEGGRAIPGADTDTFRVLSEEEAASLNWEYDAEDKNRTYRYGEVVKSVR